MKSQNHSVRSPSLARWLARLSVCSLTALPLAASGELTEISETPLSGASSMDIKPNILFIMDDSLSMEETFLPDWAGMISYRKNETDESSPVDFWYPADYQSLNSRFNGVAYNPRVRYMPPSHFDESGVLVEAESAESKYPSQTRKVTDGWKKVPVDGYNIQSDGKVNLVGTTDDPASPTRAAYYDTVAGEYCTDQALRDCRAGKAEGYTVPAYLRWCKTAADAAMATPKNEGDAKPNCQAVFIDYSGAKDGGVATYMYPRMPSARTSTISLTGSGTTTVGSIKVNGKEIMSGPASEAAPDLLAKAVAQKIQDCANRKTGACEVVGYQAAASGSAASAKLVINAPDGTTAQPVLVVDPSSGAVTVATPTPFAEPADNPVSGYIRFVPITPAVTAYEKADSRTDCAGSVCTYDEEMTNYANWHAYYRTRMQAMKTAASRSFEQIDEKYRIGYLSINNNTKKDFQNIEAFDGESKGAWYKKLFDATPYRDVGTADTPLRKALSQAGWLFAGKYNGQTLYGETVVDPIQHYCQNNAVILSTDGYWNVDAGFDLNGNDVGDQDGPDSGEARPMLDGGVGLRSRQTEKWTKKITPTEATWRQRKEEQWVMDVAGYDVKTRTKPQKETASLQRSQRQYGKQVWELRTRTYSYLSAYTSTPNEWTKKVKYLKKTTKKRQKQELQRYESAYNRVEYSEAKLYKVPLKWYSKSVQKLYERVTRVIQTNSDLGTTTTIEPGGQCVIKPPYQGCDWAPPTDWTEVSSCDAVAGGEIPGGSGDDRYAKRAAKRECQYRYSKEVVEVPAAAKEKVATCQASDSTKIANFTIAEKISCQTEGVESGKKEVTSCEPDAEYKCEYQSWSPRAEWEGSSACTPVESKVSPYAGPGRRCYDGWLNKGKKKGEGGTATTGGVEFICTEEVMIKTGEIYR